VPPTGSPSPAPRGGRLQPGQARRRGPFSIRERRRTVMASSAPIWSRARAWSASSSGDPTGAVGPGGRETCVRPANRPIAPARARRFWPGGPRSTGPVECEICAQAGAARDGCPDLSPGRLERLLHATTGGPNWCCTTGPGLDPQPARRARIRSGPYSERSTEPPPWQLTLAHGDLAVEQRRC